MMSKDKERRDSIFKIKSYKKFNFKLIRNVERFRRRIYATYST